jgi:hypothetical protein
LFVLLAGVEVAWTQVTSPGPTSESGPDYGLVAFVLVTVLVTLTGIAVKLYDTKRKREDEAGALQARLSDALATEPALGHFPIMPTVRVPFVRYPHAVILLTGVVPTPALREAVLRFVSLEAAFLTDTYRIEDRLVVDTQMFRHAA